eukprot:1142162-Pelagomonas_calceolata.AAC.2
MTAKDTQPIEEPPNKISHSNCRLSITLTQIINSTQNTAYSNAVTPTQQDSPAGGPPSKRTRSITKHTSTPMPQPLSQDYQRANASQSTVNYVPTQPNSPCITDTGLTGKSRNPPSCPNTPHNLDTQINKHKNKKLLHIETELTPPVINPLSLLCQASEVWKHKNTSVHKLTKAKTASHAINAALLYSGYI